MAIKADSKTDVLGTAHSFWEAIEARDADAVIEHFDDDSQMFVMGHPQRLDGKAAIAEFFKSLGDRPSRKVEPLDLRIREFGDTALLSFNVGMEGTVNQRTWVLRRTPKGWRIIHFHASAVAPE